MPKWSKEQDNVLMEHGHEGAERCASIIRHRFGVARTPEAVQRRASRIGASMLKWEICIGCGAKVSKLYDDGLCPTCHTKRLIEKNRAETDRIREQIRKAESSDEYIAAKREYARVRKENSSLRKKHRLSNCGDFVDLSKDLSKARSKR